MSSSIITKLLLIRNMTCVNCENIIEKELSEIAGIEGVKASYGNGTVSLTYDESIITMIEIEKILAELNYFVKKDEPEAKLGKGDRTPVQSQRTAAKTAVSDYSDIIAVLIILVAVYMIANRLGLLTIFNSFPLAKEGMGYGMLFVIGILTSVHCVAMCGGICLSQCVPKNQTTGITSGRLETIKPSLLYNLGRVISYTIIGAIVGAIGSVVSFSGTMKGFVQLAAGVFMVIMGLNMLNIFPGLRKFNPRMPKLFAKKIYAKRLGSSPLYIGLLNGLMPCGPLQAMQLYALSTGSPIKGAIAMFLFSIGTFPLMFLFGALSSFMNKKFSGRLMKFSAVLVVLLGVFMFNSGISLSGIHFPSLPKSIGREQDVPDRTATIKDGVQIITTGLEAGSYEPITVQKGIPVKWTIQAEKGDINGCNNGIVIPKLGLTKDLSVGDNVIEFTAKESGVISYSCWMGMIRSKITVVDDISVTSDSDINEDKIASDLNEDKEGIVSSVNIDQEAITSDVNTDKEANSSASVSDGEIAEEDGQVLADYNNLLEITIPTKELAIAEIVDGIQTVALTLGEEGFQPAVAVVQKGIETRWIIHGERTGLDNRILFPYYYSELQVQEGENKISFYPDQDFDFYTKDGSYYGYVKVVEDIKLIDEAAIRQEVAEYQPSDQPIDAGSGLPSCH